MKNCFLMLSFLKINIIFVLDLGLDVVRRTGNVSSMSTTSNELIFKV